MYKRQSKKRDNYYGLVTDLYFKKGMSVRAISKKTLLSRITIQRWICLYAEENGIDMAPEKPKGRIKNQAVATTSEPIPEGDEKRLRAEIRRLELELKREKLRADLNEEIINVAQLSRGESVTEKKRDEFPRCLRTVASFRATPSSQPLFGIRDRMSTKTRNKCNKVNP